jgi:hypothetical protein
MAIITLSPTGLDSDYFTDDLLALWQSDFQIESTRK